MFADMKRMEVAARLSMGHVNASMIDRRSTGGSGLAARLLMPAVAIALMIGGAYLIF